MDYIISGWVIKGGVATIWFEHLYTGIIRTPDDYRQIRKFVTETVQSNNPYDNVKDNDVFINNIINLSKL